MNERLQQAQNARSQSPASSLSGGVSPFRQGSPLAPTSASFGSPRAKLGTAAQVREQRKAEITDAGALRQNMAQEQETPKTISPKDVELEYHESEEDSKMPLFSDNASEYDQQQYAGGNTGYNATAVKYEAGYSNLPTSRADNNWNSQQQTKLHIQLLLLRLNLVSLSSRRPFRHPFMAYLSTRKTTAVLPRWLINSKKRRLSSRHISRQWSRAPPKLHHRQATTAPTTAATSRSPRPRSQTLVPTLAPTTAARSASRRRRSFSGTSAKRIVNSK